MPWAIAQASSGQDLFNIMSALSSLNVPCNITLLNHVTLADVRSIWPATGFVTKAVNIRGADSPAGRLVLDLAGVSGFVQLPPGEIATFENLQVSVSWGRSAWQGPARACIADLLP